MFYRAPQVSFHLWLYHMTVKLAYLNISKLAMSEESLQYYIDDNGLRDLLPFIDFEILTPAGQLQGHGFAHNRL